MPREENGIVRQRQDFFPDGLHQGLIIPTIHIRPAKTCLKNRIADKGNAIFLAVIQDTIRRMPRGIDDRYKEIRLSLKGNPAYR